MWTSRLLEKLRALAQTGLNYADNLPYHKEIYLKILELCYEPISERDEIESVERWKQLLKELGVVTPKVGSVVAIARDGEVLLLQRPTGRWCLPCGYADIGETPEATALREANEETGLEITLRYFLGLSTTSDDVAIPFMWEAIYIAEIEAGTLQLSHEHISAEWVKNIDERLWHSTHQTHVQRALAFLRNPHGFQAIAINSIK